MAEPTTGATVTRDLEPLSFRAALEPKTVDPEKRTVDLVWTTGARVLRGFFEPWYEELSTDSKHVRMKRLNNGAPFLDTHKAYEGAKGVLGVVVAGSARLENGKGVATVRFAKPEDDPEADKVFRKIADGILQNVSVGYRTYKLEKVEAGEGKTPVFRATDWEPFEISVVPSGADDGAGFRSTEAGTPNQCVFVTHSQETRAMADPIPPATPATPEARRSAVEEATRAAKSARIEDAKLRAEAEQRAAEDARTAERERVAGIRNIARRSRLGDGWADALIEGGTTVEEARAAAFDKLADEDERTPTTQHTRYSAGDDASDKFRRGASAWLFTKAGAVGVVEKAQKALPGHEAFRDVALDPGEFRGMSLLDLARESLERANVKTRGINKNDLAGAALTYRSSHGFNTTSDFAAILENTLHKLLLASYAVTQDTWGNFCYRGSVADFRPHNRYRLGSFGTLDALTEHGEFKQKAIPDAEKQLISASTKGNIISLSRQAIINDDMSAFSRLATMLGRAAKLSIEVDVYALLALNAGLGPAMGDGLTLFHANHANVGTGAAITAASIYADRVVLASQKDPSKNEILDLRPHCLCVPVGLGGDARVINEAQYDPDTVNKLQRPNYSRGFFNVICDTPRLSGTRRYMFADPNVAPVIEVAFLDGQSEPFLDVMNGWRVDGVDWKVRLDYGVGPIDYRGAVTNAGVGG
jgi:hypothetical protein